MNKVAIVTGGSGGIGRGTARALRDSGCRVYEMSRREIGLSGVTHISADVSDEARVAEAVRFVYEKEGSIDILINNAGFGISGASEFTNNEDAKALLDVNLFGTVNASKAVIPYMRKNGAGRIVNVSSVAAAIPIPFQSWYSVSKAAVNAFTAALIGEVSPFGISVCAVMPGDINSGFTAARKKSRAGDDIYSGRINRSVGRMEKDETNGTPPEKAARSVCRIALKKRVKPFYTVGAKYKFFIFLSRVLPARIISRIVGLLYAG
ncbi:MAG: SDR family NAD(P)-dependent oxidoreductase [Oscillospiraceae bacterium]|nr:SDR family NAD(P)-dependent oxidoreductase [Oscillospiraceae bacterium]